jgi:phosphatidate cytidylyltransferase
MNETLKRGITGIGFVIVMLGSAMMGRWAFLCVIALVNILGLLEYGRIFKHTEYAPFTIIMAFAGSIAFLITSQVIYGTIATKFIVLLLPLLLFFLVIELYHKRVAPFERAGISAMGIIYISLPLAIFPSIAMLGTGGVLTPGFEPMRIIGCLLLIWSNDTFAYLSGRMLGKTPLFPTVSPKKTWEGSIGGAICTILVSFLLHYFYPGFSLFEWMGLAVIFIFFSTWGDLAESRLKRSFGLKDSGTLLPGHGGILDRFDAQLFSIPFAAAFLWIVH